MIQMPGKHLFVFALLLFLLSWSFASGADDVDISATDSGLSLSGAAFVDDDGDGFHSADESGLVGVTVRLMQEDVEMASAITDDYGDYAFEDLHSGRYRLKADSMPGSIQTAPGRGYYEVFLSDKPAYDLDFGFISSGSLSAVRSLRQYPLMHPTPGEADLWSSQYNSSAMVFLSPEIAARVASGTPGSCSLLDKLNYNATERDQGQCGNCWVWAGTGVMEIDYARQMGISDRFSIQYLDSSYNGGCGSNGACCGGWLDYLASFYRSTKMIIPWSNANAHYQDGTSRCGGCSPSASQISTSPHYSLKSISVNTIPTRGLNKEQAIANIKAVLLQDKAIWFGFFLPDSSSWSSFYDFWGNGPESQIWKADFSCGNYYSYQSGGGHAVLCVGYDDSDPNNRYWIMLNSWGTTPGRPAGLFRVSMDMNYDCTYSGLGYAFYWMTLDMRYEDRQNRAPQTPATPQGPSQGYKGKSLTYATTSSDEDGDTFLFTFDWGDGTASDTRLSTSERGTTTHIWKKGGDFQVKARATDSNEEQSAWSEALSVKIAASNNKPPNRPSTPAGVSSGYADRSYSFVAYATDPNRDPIYYTFDWGDGEYSETEVRASGLSARLSHSWSRAGGYSVRVKATDSEGAESAWSYPKEVRIKDAPSRRGAWHAQEPSESNTENTRTCPCQKN